jgi:hypothetical protein
MMRPVHYRLLALLLVAALMVGCSSDSGTDTTLKQGDPNNPAFLAMKAEVGTVLDSLAGKGFEPLTNPWGFPIDITTEWKDKFPHHPDDTMEYNHDEDGWYSFYLGSFATSSNTSLVDSVLFIQEGIPVYHYNAHTTDIEFREHVVSTYDGESQSYNEWSNDIEATYSDVNGSVVTVDAQCEMSQDEYVSDGSTSEHESFQYTITVTDLQYERSVGWAWNDNTPADGTVRLVIAHTSQVTLNNETTTTTTNWTFNAELSENGTATVEAISNNTRWSYTEEINE